MPHEIESLFYTGETPWHGLGVKLDKVATSKEAIIAAGLDWEVSLNDVLTKNTGGAIAKIPNYAAVTRESDGKVFGIMKSRFKPIQNREAFEFFDEIVDEKLAIYHTAGSLKGGAIVWILAKLPKNFIIKGEEIDKYVLLSNSHDGTRALQMFYTPVRVVCMNTLQMADASSSSKFYARHTTNVMGRVSMARQALGIADKFYRNWKEQADKLSVLQLPAPKRPMLLKAAFTGNPEMEADKIWAPVQKAMDKAEELISVGRGNDNPKIQGTCWQAYNGITEYVDYYRNTRKNDPGQRLNSAWFGSGNEIKERAWDYLLKV
jgi:phage/plasmid-like protein (TIGR03299 family)